MVRIERKVEMTREQDGQNSPALEGATERVTDKVTDKVNQELQEEERHGLRLAPPPRPIHILF